MKQKVIGAVMAAGISIGCFAPFAGTAHAETSAESTTDPVLCFVAAQAIITEALHEFREGHLTSAELRSVLVGTASFLGDCLTPSDSSPPDPPVVPPVIVPPVIVPPANISIPPIHFPTFPIPSFP